MLDQDISYNVLKENGFNGFQMEIVKHHGINRTKQCTFPNMTEYCHGAGNVNKFRKTSINVQNKNSSIPLHYLSGHAHFKPRVRTKAGSYTYK